MYFDYAASSIKRKDVIKDLIEDMDLYEGNASSMYKLGRNSNLYLDLARTKIAESINAKSKDIVFTSGASESNNMIIKNFNGQEIITSKIEHKSVLEPLNANNKTTYINVDKSGSVNFNELKNLITKETKLVTIMYVNNETGVIQPVKQIGKYINKLNKDDGYNIWFHIDAVQAFGHIDINIEELHCDSLSLSGHKIGGLNGFGVLYLRKKIKPLIQGGNQEKGLRAGTSNVLGAMSMANSIDKIKDEHDHIYNIKKYFIDNLKVPFEVNGDLENTVNHIVNLYFPFVKSNLLLTFLDINDIYVSAGSACNAGSLEPSYVIETMYDKNRSSHSIRFSFGFTNKQEEVDKLISLIELMYERKNRKS